MENSPPPDAPHPPVKRSAWRWVRRVFLVLALILTALLAWLNGPGWKFISERLLRQQFERQGIAGNFEFSGSLVGGIAVENVDLSGQGFTLRAREMRPLYNAGQFRLLEFRLKGLEVSVDLSRLPKKNSAPDRPKQTPKDLKILLDNLRNRLIPLRWEVESGLVQVSQGMENRLKLDSLKLSHDPNSSRIALDLGAVGIGPRHQVPAQRIELDWKSDRIQFSGLRLLPELAVGISALDLSKTPWQLSSQLQYSGGVLDVQATAASLSARLTGEPWDVSTLAQALGYPLPVQGRVSALGLEFQGVIDHPEQWQVQAQVSLDQLSYHQWQVDQLHLDLTQKEAAFQLNARAQRLGAVSTLSSEGKWPALAQRDWTKLSVQGNLEAPELRDMLVALREPLHLPGKITDFPKSRLTVAAGFDSAVAGHPHAEATLHLSPVAEISPLQATVAWQGGGEAQVQITADGAKGSASWSQKQHKYEGQLALTDWKSSLYESWLLPFGIKLPGEFAGNLQWQGQGSPVEAWHRGTLVLEKAQWQRPEVAPLLANAQGSYDWPLRAEFSNLELQSGEQSLLTSARYADALLDLPKLEWREGGDLLLSGRASIPVGREVRDLQGFLRQTQPLSLFLESAWIDPTRLDHWVPQRDLSDLRGRAKLHLIVTGSPANPQVELQSEAQGLAIASQPKVPTTGAAVELTGRDGKFTLTGKLTPQGYPAITLNGDLPFLPGRWADHPAEALDEKISAVLNVPSLQLSALKLFLPDSIRAEGGLAASLKVSGTLHQPELRGEVKLSRASLDLPKVQMPPIEKIEALLKFEQVVGRRQARLENLSCTSAGGALSGRGTVDLSAGAQPLLDFTLRGKSLPLLRNDAMILRADADLALNGPYDKAKISGSLRVVDSLYYRDFELLPLRMPFTTPSRPRLPSLDVEPSAGSSMPAPFRDWALDVDVKTQDLILIRGNLADGSLRLDAKAGGTLGKIRPDGVATLRKVKARLPFSTLDIQEGTARFFPDRGLIPDLNITGTSTISAYDVTVFFYGPANSAQTALTSDPPLPESEIMTLLATGATSSGLEGGQAAGMKAAQLLVEEWRKGRVPYGKQLARLLEILNRVDVRVGEDDPLTGRRMNSATLQFSKGWYASGSTDEASNSRGLVAYVLRFY
jgi:TamB, inner membrane protein subunit of TAM complex